ncbi:MAG: sulfatase [Vicinamibacteria bacterium]|nr:sulfatase [Vicinamibacteria bacterium]
MTRAHLLTAVFLALGALGCPGKPALSSKASAASSSATPVAKERPVIILITIDTLRPDHMSVYGYARATTPRLKGWAKMAAVFQEAYTYWPKTRGSFVAIMTGRTAGESGYSPKHPELHAFNPTLAETLQRDGYDTAAFVDNANVSSSLGFSRGFKTYAQMWADPSLLDEVARTEEITKRAIEYVRAKGRRDGYFLWLHYVNPHAPYTPPRPFDRAFPTRERSDRTLKVVDGFFGGVSRPWAEAMPGRTRLSDFVNAYDGEIAYVDTQVDEVLRALDANGSLSRSTVIISSDHGESLGEHDYYFDHGANLFDPVQRIPFIVVGRGATAVRSDVLVSTLDIMPTLLDAARVSFPSGLAGRSVLPFAAGRKDSTRDTLVGENDRGHQGIWNRRYKLIDTNPGAIPSVREFYDRAQDPREIRPRSDLNEVMKAYTAGLDEYRDIELRSGLRTRLQLEGKASPPQSRAECEQLKAMGYVAECR